MAAELTPRQARFVQEYLVDLNATQAAIRAGYSPKTAEQQGYRLLRNVQVAAAIQAAVAARGERTTITAEKVLAHLWDIATADPNELIQFRRMCCRCCWGAGHRWQYTEGEMRTRRDAHDRKADTAEAEAWDADGAFDEGGGIGYDEGKDPNPKCPECFGQGVGQAFVPDSRKLTGAARRLYAGVKVTKEGLQVQMRSQDGALRLLFDHLGLSAPARAEVSGPGGAPIETHELTERLANVPKEGREALRAAIKAAMEK